MGRVYFSMAGGCAGSEGNRRPWLCSTAERPRPARYSRYWELMRLHSTWYGTGGIATFAISAIDTALHDLKGKALGVPVYQLLGGKVTPKLRAVASIIFDTVNMDATAEEFAGYVARGYTAVKGGWGKSADTAFGLDPKRDLLAGEAHSGGQ